MKKNPTTNNEKNQNKYWVKQKYRIIKRRILEEKN